ncbi:hypothetical protein JW777_00720 [bacterium]|nr:hypothetical protein [bacterium]
MSERLIQILADMVARRQWQKLLVVARGLMEFDGSLYLKRNAGAVERVKEAFQRIHGKPAYPARVVDTMKWDRKLAGIVDAIGVSPLIDDMKQNSAAFPESIFYYVHSVSGRSPRWELLMFDEIRRREREDLDLWKVMADSIGAESGLQAGRSVDPDWVTQARRRLEELMAQSKRARGTVYTGMIREMKTIEARLQTQGFEVRKKGEKG